MGPQMLMLHQRGAMARLTHCSAAAVFSSRQLRRPVFSAHNCSWMCHSASPGVSAPATSSSQTTPSSHNHLQVEEFSQSVVVEAFLNTIPDSIQQRLAAIVAAIPDLSGSSRVVDVGSGTGCMIPHLQARGVQDILAVDLSAAMLDQLRAIHAPTANCLGNQLGVRTWQGDVVDLPNYLGWAADAFIFNGVFGNLYSPRAALLKAALQLRPGGCVVISHPMGRTWHTALATQQPTITPHLLPDRAALDLLIEGLPLQVVEYHDEPELYLAVLQVPLRYSFPQAPVRLQANVVTGFGRGSRQLGTPTANLDPKQLQDILPGLQRGVYFGWAQLTPGGAGWTPSDLEVHKMVMNVGRRPTVNTGDEDPTVEVHVMHEYSRDFYGEEMRAVALGYIRPELKFTGGLPELLGRIKLDIAIGRSQLDDPSCAQHKDILKAKG